MRDDSFTPWGQDDVSCGYHFLQIASQPFKVHWLPYVPPCLTFNESAFCPHTVFMCFVWISEQTAIISLYSIDWLVFITETECLLRGTFYILCSAHTVFMCSVWISDQTAIISQHWLTGFYNWDGLFTARYVLHLYVLPTQCICVFCVDFRKNSDYFTV